jgi:hypothetical protein
MMPRKYNHLIISLQLQGHSIEKVYKYITQLDRFDKMNRNQLIGWLSWNDPNGIYSDKDSENDGFKPITLKEAKEIAIKMITENL